jgi:hypothetical protein
VERSDRNFQQWPQLRRPAAPEFAKRRYIYYTGSLSSNSSAILAVWPEAQAPTAGGCQTWVTTHPRNSFAILTAGMQICLQTAQGRPVLLHVTSVTAEELDAYATIWQQQ